MKHLSSAVTFSFILAFSSLIFAAPAPKKPQIFNFNTGSGAVTFQAIGRPAAIKINGDGEKPTGLLQLTDNRLSGELNFELKSLKTGISLRDTHMKEKYLEVEKYPKATLKIADLKVPEDLMQKADAQLKSLPFKGMLQLKGKEKEVQGTCDVDRKNGITSVSAQFTIKLPEFGVEIPKYMGITVAEDVVVKVATSASMEESK